MKAIVLGGTSGIGKSIVSEDVKASLCHSILIKVWGYSFKSLSIAKLTAGQYAQSIPVKSSNQTTCWDLDAVSTTSLNSL